MRCYTLLCLLLMGASPLVAQDYPIQFVRMVKVGERYHVEAKAIKNQVIKLTVNGQAAPPKNDAQQVVLSADVEVLGATPKGREAKAKFVIAKMTSTVGEQTSEVIPVGTEVVAECTGTKTEFQIAGMPASPEVAKALALVISMQSEDKTNDDAIFGTSERKKVGDSWPSNSAAAAADLAKRDKLKIDPKDFSGTVTVKELVKGADGDQLHLISDFSIQKMEIPLPPGLTVQSSLMTGTLSGLFPVDLTRRASKSTMQMGGKILCGGKTGDREMSMDMTMEQSREAVFTAK